MQLRFPLFSIYTETQRLFFFKLKQRKLNLYTETALYLILVFAEYFVYLCGACCPERLHKSVQPL